jgi:hypothetical protein
MSESGRDGNGRFTAGNTLNPGNQPYKRLHELRRLFLASVTDDDVQEAIRQLVTAAKAGEPWAIKEFFDRTLGKAPQAVELSGPDGQPLGVNMFQVAAAIELVLGDDPGKKHALAVAIRQLEADSNGSGGAA